MIFTVFQFSDVITILPIHVPVSIPRVLHVIFTYYIFFTCGVFNQNQIYIRRAARDTVRNPLANFRVPRKNVRHYMVCAYLVA